MDCTTLIDFRTDVYAAFTRAADAMFDLADALMTDTQAQSLIELALSPAFRRRWPSLYEALEDGIIDAAALRQAFVAAMPAVPTGKRPLLGIDASSLARPDAHTSADRTHVYQANTPHGANPTTPGWSFSAVVQLDQPVSSWSYILDHQRIASTSDPVTVGASQLAALLPLLDVRPMVLLDRYYSRAPWLHATATLPVDQFIRARSDQVLYRAAPERTGKPGRPRLDGARFQGRDASTHGTPDATATRTDAAGRTIGVAIWHHLHIRKARAVDLSVVRITRSFATDTKRDPRESWFWWHGEDLPPLAEVGTLYGHRFGQEHGYRFDKQDLLWDTARVRTPAQIERWTQIVAMVHHQIVVARTLGIGERRPWESTRRPASPQQVRRAMAHHIRDLGTPAAPPQPRGKAPGRAVGASVKRAPRHPVIRKTSKTPKTKQKEVVNQRK